MTKDNNLLGQFDLTGIPPAPRGVPQVEVSFDLDANGILNVSAKESSTGKSKNIVIKNDKGRLSKDDIDRMINDAEKYKEEDEKQRQKVQSRNSLEGYIFQVKQALDDAGDKLTESEKTSCRQECDNTLKWLDNNTLAEKDEYDDKLKELQKTCMPIMSKIHKAGGGGAGAPGGPGGPTINEVD